jgi:DNA-binding response OmpR family regulator
MKTLRVLIVDATCEAEKLAQWVLVAGHDAKVCHDGVDAQRVASAYRPDVALLSVDAPNTDGWELATRLRRAAPSLFIAVATAASSSHGKQRAEAAGFRLYLRKPMRRRTLLRMLDDAVTTGVTVKESPEAVAIEKLRSQAVATHICSRFRQVGADARVAQSLETKEYHVTVVGIGIDEVREVLGALHIDVRSG